jgi:hypothetical protein
MNHSTTYKRYDGECNLQHMKDEEPSGGPAGFPGNLRKVTEKETS